MMESRSSVETGMKLIEQFDLEVEAVHPTGSRYICTPIVWDTDEDYVVLVDDDINKFADSLVAAGWTKQTAEEYRGEKSDNKFVSVRMYWWNLILVNDKEEFDKWVAASEEARKRNLRKKWERIALFEEFDVGGRKKKKSPPPPVYNDPVFEPLTEEEEILLELDEIDRALQVIQNEQ